MEGKDHKGFAVAGAMTINSIVYFVTPTPIFKTSESFLHVGGIPWTWPYLIHQWQTFHTIDLFETLVYKITFYCILVLFASLPDRLERRRRDDTGIPVKHRGFTHSCFFVFLLVILGIIGTILIGNWLAEKHVHLSPFFMHELLVAGSAILLTIVLHIIADGLTKQGVKVMWPNETSLGALPRDMRFTNESMGPSIVLWGMYFIAGSLFALGIVGF